MSDIISLVGPRKVRVSRVGVALFNAQWPCSRLSDSRAYWFEFDMDGVLIDTDVPESQDGVEATAMADDCLSWLEDDVVPDWLPE